MRTTPSQTVGPFFSIGLCRSSDDVLDAEGVELNGTLFDGRGDPVWDAMVEVWDPSVGSWGRSSTDSEGRFRFRIRPDAEVLEAFVFARGLLRHQRTRIHLGHADAAEDPTLVAVAADGGFLFDIRMQGDQATLFFEH
jgi:protocatechuate 3,4-dioxygenase, alpha subunit